MKIEILDQKYKSIKTGFVNWRCPAIFKKIDFKPNTINLDYGGGAYSAATDYLSILGVENLVFDLFCQTKEHNESVLKKLEEIGGADTVVLSNVLNVICEEEVRLSILRNCKKMCKKGGEIYICCYAGDRSGIGKESRFGWQENRKLKSYIKEISQVFSNIVYKVSYITVIND